MSSMTSEAAALQYILDHNPTGKEFLEAFPYVGDLVMMELMRSGMIEIILDPRDHMQLTPRGRRRLNKLTQPLWVYISGATAHEFQVARYWIRLLKFRFWFRPYRSHGTWIFPNYISVGKDKSWRRM